MNYITKSGEIRKYPQQRYQKTYRLRHKEKLKELNAKWVERNLSRVLFITAKRRAKQNNIPFNIELSDVIIPNICPVLKIPLKRGKHRNIDSSPTIDRFIPKLGYIKGNITVISSLANRIKTNATLKQIELVICWIKKKQTQLRRVNS